MKKWIKRVIIIGIIVIAGLQFIPVHRNISTETLSTDFIQTFNPPEKVADLISNSCYNCHSNNTSYPWYSYIQPVGLYLQGHINEGKEHLNLSEFGNYSARRQNSKLTMMIDQIENNQMPLPAYTLIHRDAKLSGGDKKLVLKYLQSLKDSL